MSQSSFIYLSSEKIVMRLGPEAPPETIFDAGSGTAHPKLFMLSSNDKDQNPPRLSVFDRDRTTPKQARDILERPQHRCFKLLVEEVLNIDPDRLSVIEDPLSEGHPCFLMPGADGHCGILGLDRRSGEPKKITQNLRSKLLEIAIEMTD